jgi:hypothetical protein
MLNQLPESFQDLAPLLEWALPTEHERRAKRTASSMVELRSFYDAMLLRMDDALSFLAEIPADNPPDDVQTLFLLATSLAEIAPAIEMYGEQSAEGLDVLRLKSIDIYPLRKNN